MQQSGPVFHSESPAGNDLIDGDSSSPIGTKLSAEEAVGSGQENKLRSHESKDKNSANPSMNNDSPLNCYRDGHLETSDSPQSPICDNDLVASDPTAKTETSEPGDHRFKQDRSSANSDSSEGTTTSSSEGEDMAVESDVDSEASSDEDFEFWFCDGPCYRGFRNFDEIHFCRTCYGTCFCKNCLAKLQSPQGFGLRTHCNGNHEFIRAYPPVEEAMDIVADLKMGRNTKVKRWLNEVRSLWPETFPPSRKCGWLDR